MQLVWLLPALLMSLMFASRSGSAPIFLLSFLAVAIQLSFALVKSLNLAEAPNLVSISEAGVFLDGKKLPASSKLWSRRARLAVHKHVTSLPDEIGDSQILAEVRRNTFACTEIGNDCWVGVSNGKSFELRLQECVHILIVGPTGSGKSQFLALLLNSLFASKRPEDLTAVLVDFKGSALLASLNQKDRFARTIDDLDQASHVDFWNHLLQQLDERERLSKCQAELGQPSIHGTFLVVVDELAAVLKNPKASETLTAIATRGRSLGFVLILANQGTAGVPRELIQNLRTRIGLQSIDPIELVQLGGSSKKIIAAQTGWVSARMMRNDSADVEFKFPVASGLN